MAEIPHEVVSPTFERQALTILGAKNELDAPDFDPVDYVNRFFPNGKWKNSTCQVTITKATLKNIALAPLILCWAKYMTRFELQRWK